MLSYSNNSEIYTYLPIEYNPEKKMYEECIFFSETQRLYKKALQTYK